MVDIDEQIFQIEKEIRETPYHKGTEHHIGKLRARLARLKDREIESYSKKAGGGGYAIKKEGDATVVLVGPPSSGKSTLLNKLTNAESKVAPYAFTTVSPVPGMMKYKDAYIQILDIPGLISGAREGKGRGREVLSVVRGADLLIIMTDVERYNLLASMEKELEAAGIRINKKPPEVIIDKKVGGGITIHSNMKQDINKDTLKEIAQEFRIRNAEVTIKEKLSVDRLIDAFSPNRVYIPTITLINKIDLYDPGSSEELLAISAETGKGLNDLKENIWKKLGMIRVYLVGPDEKPSLKSPVIMKENQTLKEVAEKVGDEFVKDKTFAKIWGASARFPGQEVSLSTPIAEEMQIRFL